MATAGTLEYLISIDSSKLNSGMASAESKVKGFGNRISAGTVAMGHMIANFATKAIGTTTRFVKDAVQSSMSFDKSMAQVAATLGKTTSEVQDLSKFARKMGAETAFTAEEAAQGLNYMALAGYDAEKSMKMLPQVLNLAAAGNFDLARASDMVTDAQSALGLSIEQTETLIDQMAKASSKTNTSVEQLGDAILTVGGTAKMMKGGTQELTAVLGVLADNGIKGSEGGTALRNVLLSLSAPTNKASKQLKQLGVSVFDAKGNMRSLPDIIQDINEAMDGMVPEERTKVLNEIFNKRDLKAAEALLGTQKDRWQELYKEIGNAKGAAKEMAETQLDNLAGDVTKFKSALGETKLAIVEKLTPAFRKWTQFATVSVQRITKAFQKKGLKGAIEEVKFIFGETMDVLRNSSSKVISTIGKIGYLFKDGFKGIKVNAATLLGIDDPQNTTWAEIGGKIKEKLKGGIQKAKIVIADLLDIPDPEHADWTTIASEIVTRLKAKIKGGGDFIKGLILGDQATEDSTWADVADALTDKVRKAFEKGGLFDIILGEATDFIDGAITFGGNLIQGIANWIAQPENIQTLVNLVEHFVEAIIQAAPSIIEALVKIFASPTLWTAVFNALGNLGTSIVDMIFGKEAADRLRRILGIQANGEFSDSMNNKFRDEYMNYFKQYNSARNSDDKRQIAKQWNETVLDAYAESAKMSDEQKAKFKKLFDWDNIFKAYTVDPSKSPKEMLREAIDAWNNGEESILDIKAKLMPDLTEVKAADGMVLNGMYVFKPVFEGGGFGGGGGAGLSGGTAGMGGGGAGGGGGSVDIMSKWMNPYFNAKGNWNVPYDNYPSLLHRGEMVLNKSQARQFRDGVSGDYDMGSMVSDAVSSAMSKVYVMLSGEKVGDLTTKRVRKNINATTYNKLRAMGG